MKEAVTNHFSRRLPPGVLNRIDQIIVFHTFDEGHLKQIVEIEFNGLRGWADRHIQPTRYGLGTRALPLQLCDVTVWMTVAACLTVTPWVVEMDYFAGIAGAGTALITPDLWSPWPSYTAVYFFLAHGGIAIGIGVVVFGGIAPLRPGAVWLAFGGLLAYAAFVGGFNAVFHTNYMYLCTRPASESILNAFGPWPVYLIQAAGLTLLLFWLLWLPTRRDTYDRYCHWP